MANRTFLYVDGESHFVRSEAAWRSLHGAEACLSQLRHADQPDERLTLVLPAAKVFWTRRLNAQVQRATYFTTATGDLPTLHALRVAVRDFGLEPAIEHERRDLRTRRDNAFDSRQIIEKPKGVDIAIAVRMLEDSHRHAFDVCHLYTSDVDFLPVIEAIRAHGKQVFVHGYRKGLSEHSPLLHIPDLFVDLEVTLRNDCELVK